MASISVAGPACGSSRRCALDAPKPFDPADTPGCSPLPAWCCY
ncbi:MAG: hypothetical protein WKG07_34245 [Hymenobacter sp.]